MTLKETIALTALAAVWGGSFLFIRIAAAAFGPAALMAGRVMIAACVLGVLLIALRKPRDLRRHASGLLFLGLVNAAIPFTLIAAAELRITASLAATLNATVPLFSALLSARWLDERLTSKRVTGLMLGLSGVVVLVGWSPIALSGPVLMSVGAMLLATFCYAVAAVYAKKRLADASPMTMALGQQLAASAWLIGPALWLHPAKPPGMTALWALIGLAVLSTALAYLLYFHLLARIGPTRTYTVTYLIPLFGMLWGAWFLGEKITNGMFAGLACIIGSLLLINDLKFAGVTRRLPNVFAIRRAKPTDRKASNDNHEHPTAPAGLFAAPFHPVTEQAGPEKGTWLIKPGRQPTLPDGDRI
jgi:drug/metabolite transporter (DMT)-like permease